ncbi:sigma-70 family RNA polymerase sigma factor [uncultured Chitinophaga sp.]|uniref:RNA polymerase sigma factor n=1 Tax=uncultured Chitinophaga sp. TaxID=339340 RepID=UPI0025EABC88|nr:sigma-70 family RNA polymerase sigma factor [uncultured Chitinophaga sp.]
MNEYNRLTDENLWELVKTGSDHSAYAELYDRYFVKLRRFVTASLKDDDTANDIVQDLFLYLWMKRDEIDIHFKVANFLYRASLFQLLKTKRKSKVVQTYIQHFQKFYEEGHFSTDNIVAVKETTETMERALKNMRPKTKMVFESSRFANMQNGQISEYYGIPKNTVKHLLKEALRVMRDFGLKANSWFW